MSAYIISCILKKSGFCICENKGTGQLRSDPNRAAVSAPLLDLLYNPKFQAPSYLLRLYSLVFVGPGQKPKRKVFT